MIGIVIAFTAMLSIAFVVSLAAKPKFVTMITVSSLFISVFGGVLLYGYGFAHSTTNAFLAVLRATMAACGMLLGRSDFSAVSGTPFFQTDLGIILFWMLHLLAMYATASATITTVGAGLLRNIRIWLSRRGDLVLIFGIHSGSIDFGKEMLTRKHTSVVFVDEKPNAGLVEQIRTSGGVARSDIHAVAADVRFLKSMGIRSGKRKIWLYAMSKEQAKNLHYADAFLHSLKMAEVLPEQTGLVLMGMEEGIQTGFLAEGGHYGYGNLTIIDEAQMAARRLIREYPPAKTLRFDENGRATEDLDCILFGFGRVGQAVLQQLVINGQFSGSTFHAVVFDPNCEQLTGRLMTQSQYLLDDYDIRFVDSDARSSKMYTYLDDHQDTLNYIVVCAGDDKINEEIAGELLCHFARRGYQKPVYICSYSGVQRLCGDSLPKKWKLYCADILWQNGFDLMAMAVNQIYCQGNGKTMLENWEACDYFSRMSSRAFADFIPSLLHIAGEKTETVARDWKVEGRLLENLAITEHMRWCAFHYAMGYAPMSPETFAQRGEQHAKERAEQGSSRLRIGKDPVHRIHACLIPWEKLDALSAAENSYTGGNVDYKAMDANNVLAMPEILSIAAEAEEFA